MPSHLAFALLVSCGRVESLESGLTDLKVRPLVIPLMISLRQYVERASSRFGVGSSFVLFARVLDLAQNLIRTVGGQGGHGREFL